MSDLQREAERQLNIAKYRTPTKVYKIVFSILIISIYAYGMYLSLHLIEG